MKSLTVILCFAVAISFIGISQFLRHVATLSVLLQDVSLVPTTGRATSFAARDARIIPDWRAHVDCSAFGFADCITAQRRRNRQYGPYPFEDLASFRSRTNTTVIPKGEPLPEEWQTALVDHAPRKVNEASSTNTDEDEFTGFVYPPQVTPSQRASCIENAQSKSFDAQLDSVLSNLMQKTIVRDAQEESIDMISFTISDEAYAQDMLHNVFEMVNDVMEFSGSFFLVALDDFTLRMACKYGYSVVASPALSDVYRQERGGNSVKEGDRGIKFNVENTKFSVSLALTERNQSFLFFEMDVFFTASPVSILRRQMMDIVASSHQEDERRGNFGVYSVIANEKTRNHFATCLNISISNPKLHDQSLMFQRDWPQEALSKPLASIKRLPPHTIVSHQWPRQMENTIAIHVLTGSPLKDPHGKKMIAKELSVWHGFRGPQGRGGYYARLGQRRRYLFLDNPGSLGGLSTSPEGYKYDFVVRVRIAFLAALCRRTNRILVLPKVFFDHDFYFLWTYLDIRSLEDVVPSWRETNFASNPKSWLNVESNVPFGSVARVALYEEGDLLVHVPNHLHVADDRNAGSVEASWTIEGGGGKATDALFSLMTTMPELDSAEAIFVNPAYLTMPYISYRLSRYAAKGELGVADTEIVEVLESLRWCKDAIEKVSRRLGVAQAKCSDDCFGLGVRLDNWTNSS